MMDGIIIKHCRAYSLIDICIRSLIRTIIFKYKYNTELRKEVLKLIRET